MRSSNPRRPLVLATSAAMVLSLAACGSDPVTDGEVGGEISFAYWGSPNRAELVGAVIGLYEDANPDVTVNSEPADYAAYVERLTVRAAGGGLACATATQSTFLTEYAQNGSLLSLDELIEAGQIDVSDIPENVLETGQVDGEQFMIPTGSFVRLPTYNAELIAAAGVEPPATPFTWEEYGDWLRALQVALPDGVYATENDGGFMFTFASWVVGHGEQLFEDGELGFTEDTLADYYQFWLDLTEEGVALPPAEIPTQYESMEVRPLAKGTVASGFRDIPGIFLTEDAIAAAGGQGTIVPLSNPTEADDRSANVIGANGISIPAECDNIATAASFVDFFTNDPGAAQAFQSDNGVVTSSSAQEALLASGEVEDNVVDSIALLNELESADDLTSAAYPAGSTTITADLLRLYQEVAFDRMTVDEAVEQFFSAAERALD